jgi:hypothetical protein
MLAGEHAPVAADALRYLAAANEEATAMERAVGTAFEVLGFKYEPRGGSVGGTDGVLKATLGKQRGEVADFKLVFDAKTSGSKRIQAGKVDCASLNRFKRDEKAAFAFAIGRSFDGEKDPTSKLNDHAKHEKITILLTGQLERLLRLHVRYGLTLKQIRDLFETSHQAIEVEQWVDRIETEISKPNARVPLKDLLEALEELKADELAEPHVAAARLKQPTLAAFPPEKLLSALHGVSAIIDPGWIEFDGKGAVHLHQKPTEILEAVSRAMKSGLGAK